MCSSNPKVLFVRPEYGSSLSRIARIMTEPLDLEYLAAVAVREGCTYQIHDPAVTGLAALAFALIVGATRMVSLGSIVALAAFPLAAFALGRPTTTVGLGIAAAVVVLIQHRDNLGRIVRGTEHRFR